LVVKPRKMSSVGPSPLSVIFRQRLKWLLYVRSRTAVDVSVEAGRDKAFVSDILNGRNTNPTIGVLLDLSRALRCDPEFLLGQQNIVRRGQGRESLSYTDAQGFVPLRS
jgi:transcriptional regulator with XRE-family HTH domain